MNKANTSNKSGEEVKLRDFRLEDLSQIKRLVYETIDVDYSYYPAEFISDWKIRFHSENRILRDALDGYTLVAEIDESFAGTGTLHGEEISRVYVKRNFQKRGIGKQIMDQLEERAKEKGINIIYLTSTTDSKPFYEARGYKTFEVEILSKDEIREVGYYKMKKQITSKVRKTKVL